MKISILWYQVQNIYDKFEFSSKLMVDDLMIISRDNYYICYFEWFTSGEWGKQKFAIRLEKDFSITKMESKYKSFIEYDDNDVSVFEDEMPERWTNLIKPIFRNFILESILDDKKN
jgi:hypothetical protein